MYVGRNYYLLCKSYQGTRKIMQKSTKKREKTNTKYTKKINSSKHTNICISYDVIDIKQEAPLPRRAQRVRRA